MKLKAARPSHSHLLQNGEDYASSSEWWWEEKLEEPQSNRKKRKKKNLPSEEDPESSRTNSKAKLGSKENTKEKNKPNTSRKKCPSSNVQSEPPKTLPVHGDDFLCCHRTITPTTQHHPLLQTCQESRLEAQKIKHKVVLRSECWHNKLKTFIQGSDDVIFFMDPDGNESQPGISNAVYDLAINGSKTGSTPLSRVAFQARSRVCLLDDTSHDLKPLLKVAEDCGVEEAIFVIGLDDELTWQLIEEHDLVMLQAVKKDFIATRDRMLLNGENVDELHVDFGWVGNPSQWTIKKISYVQAVSASVAKAAAGL
ncbi:hypothetical protein DL98DRAFT_589232 [Cadophora sp. DSE1049]|nr:hypothetical protein DL98DRAFT_589232 [Cadophora sp. DSE1049]